MSQVVNDIKLLSKCGQQFWIGRQI